MKVISKIIMLMVLVYIYGLMENHIKEHGKIIKWMDKVNFNGLMVDIILEIWLFIIRRVMVYFGGQMADNIKDYGKMANNMEKEFI